MLIDFKDIQEVTIPQLNRGEGAVSAKMHMSDKSKIMLSRLPKGASIGYHSHETSTEINYVLSGCGSAFCDGVSEKLTAGVCHYCLKGSSHSIVNTGNEDLVLFTVVADQ